MKLYVEKNPLAWNKIVESSPYAVPHHKYEVLAFGKRSLPLVFEKGGKYLLFPYRLQDVLGFKSVVISACDLTSVLPSCPEAIPLIPEALDLILGFLKNNRVDLLTMGVPFLLPKEYVSLLSKWFEEKNAFVNQVFADVLITQGKSFEEIWKDGFSKHARNRTRKAEKEGVRVHELSSFDEWVSDMCLCNMSSFYRQRRYPRYPHSERDAFLVYLNKHRTLWPENYRVYGAFLHKRLIAYMATVQFNKTVLMSLLMSLSEFLSKCPNDALLKHIIQHSCENGFSWIYYSFDRVSYSSKRPSLHSSLRRFKFEHGFSEHPVNIYSLALTRSGEALQKLISVYNYMFISSANLPSFLTDVLQRLYERQRYRKSGYEYLEDESLRST